MSGAPSRSVRAGTTGAGSGQTRSYRDVRAEVLRRIRERVWPPGTLIPGEAELAREFACSRATTNRALRELAAAGILDRKRRAGTRVSLHPVRRATLSIPVTRLEIEGRGAAYRHTLLTRRRRPPPAALAARLDLPGDADMLHVRTLHLADGRPYLYEDRWVNVDAVPAIAAAPLDRISANEWLVQNASYSRGDIAFSAAPADQTEAEMLVIEVGAALFVVERATWLGERLVTSVRLAYPPGHRMTTTL